MISLHLFFNSIRRMSLHPVFVIGLAIAFSVFFLGYWILGIAEMQSDKRMDAYRDLLLLASALIAFGLTLSRTLTAERTLLNERYQKGVEMLGSDVLQVRLGAIFGLQRLSTERAKDYHLDNVRVLCSFVRESSQQDKKGADSKERSSEDLQAAIDFLKTRKKILRQIERRAGYKSLNLSGANLQGLDLSNGDLSNTVFDDANLANATLAKTQFKNCSFIRADLSNADLSEAKGLRLAPKMIRHQYCDLSVLPRGRQRPVPRPRVSHRAFRSGAAKPRQGDVEAPSQPHSRGVRAPYAQESGVEELSGYALQSFERYLKKQTMRSSMRFTGRLSGGNKAVVNLLPLPRDSSRADRQHYQLYKRRFATLAGLTEEQGEGPMPASRRDWEYVPDDPDWAGFEGIIRAPRRD